jgi:hypothetical protein
LQVSELEREREREDELERESPNCSRRKQFVAGRDWNKNEREKRETQKRRAAETAAAAADALLIYLRES